MPDDRPRRTPHINDQRKNKSSGWQLIAVQSISCIVVIVIALVFRMIGGTAFAELRKSFNNSIMSNSILATLAALMESPSDDNKTSKIQDATGSDASEQSTDAPASTTNGTENNKNISESNTSIENASKVAGVGGKDIPVIKKKVLYAPEGATFLPLKINRLAYQPLEDGKATSYFGYRDNPTGGGVSFHQGLDIAAKQDSPIYSMLFGVVTELGQNNSYGNYVRIYHGNGIEVLYAHCSQILVDKDAVIRAGEVVARVGSTGDSSGPHLHIEVLHKGINYDPSDIVQLENYA